MKSIESNKRRVVLKYLAGSSLFGLSGCCCQTSRPKPEITISTYNNYSESLALKPLIDKNKKNYMCIDVHAHFINASDVNVKGFVEGPVARSMESEKMRKLVRALAGVLDALAKIAPTASAEYEYLTGIYDDKSFMARGYSQKRKFLADEISKHRDKIANELLKEMKNNESEKLYIEAMNEFNNISGLSFKRVNKLTYDLVRNAIDPYKRKSEYRLLKPDTQLQAMSRDPSGLLEFVGHMLSPRWASFLDYQKYYTEDKKSFGVDAVFASLVDFDYWLECMPASSRIDQVKLLSLMSKMSGGYMLPIVSYNPWTDIKHDDASLKLVKEAINNHGYIGVKIYPANGFYPYGNEENTINTSQPRPDLKLLDKKLLEMFKWCASNKIPVMAHTAESMGSDDASDQFGGPIGWRSLFDKFEGSKDLPIINAGHFGGDVRKNNNKWTEELGEIMRSSSGKYLYGDLGYWSTLENCSGNCASKQRIKSAVEASNNIAKRRIMYGSDWLMSSKEPEWSKYPYKISNQIKDILPLERFFYKNALECFGLNKNGGQRKKIIDVFKDQPGGLPEWLKS